MFDTDKFCLKILEADERKYYVNSSFQIWLHVYRNRSSGHL